MKDESGTGDPRDGVVEHLPAMRAFAMSLTRDGSAADDLVQDTIVKAWKNFDKFAEGTKAVAAAVVEGFVCDVRVVVLCQTISAVVADVDGQTCDCVAVDSTERAARVLPDHRIAEVACQVATTHG